MHWWTRSGLCSSGIRAFLGHRLRPRPGSAKAEHKGQWLACPKPLLQPRPQVLDLPHRTSADSHCPKPPGCGQLPFFSAGKPVSGEHEQSGSAKSTTGFQGTINLTCTGGPPNSTCTVILSSVTLTSGSETAKVTVDLAVPRGASKGTSMLTFTGTSGTLTHS